jgi:lactate dehydrogenase-like 2-hydroxyacid dehydrogenase
VVVTRRIFPDLLEALRGEFELRDNQDDVPWSDEALLSRLVDADAVLVDPGRPIGAALLDGCPRLRVVSNIAVGYNNIDLAACTRLGIVATNTPDVLNEATADHAWALLMAAARRVVESDRWTRDGHWERFAFDAFLGVDVHGATLGVLGLGRIGQAVARRAQGFAMPVIYHSRQPPAVPSSDHTASQDPAAGRRPRWVSFADLLARADFLVLTVPYSAATHHLLGAAELAQMKPSAVLVNIARGGVVDDHALVAALRVGRPAAAALDVMENEPQLDPGLLALPNVVLTPHIGSATASSRRGMVSLAIENLRHALQGQRPAALLNAPVWEQRRREGACAGAGAPVCWRRPQRSIRALKSSTSSTLAQSGASVPAAWITRPTCRISRWCVCTRSRWTEREPPHRRRRTIWRGAMS